LLTFEVLLGMLHKLTYLHYSTYVRMGIVYW